ncbi:MAG: phage portal protein [Caldilineaceae bacterium]
MGFIQQLLTIRAAGHPSQHSLAAIFGLGRSSYAGVPVTDESAMTYSAVFAAIRLLSWSTAMLPLLTYRRQDRGKVRADDHPLYPLLKEEANPEMTAFDFRSTLMSHAVGRGNGYAEIEWSTSGQPIALWPLNPAKTTAERVNGQLRYLVQLPDGTTANLPSWRVHHIRGLSGNGIVGYSPVRLAMQAIGLGLATEEFGSRFFGNGARPGLIVRHPGQLSDTAFDRLKTSFNADHEGLSNSHRVKILEEGMEIETVGVPPEEAQFLETRKFQVTEIARWFNVPPHMIADMSGATFSNIEEQGVEFVTYSLGPWLTNVEQALTRDLLTPAEKKVLLIEHLVDGLLRGRTSERYAAYQSALQGGWMSPNEVRQRENLNPYEGGDTYLLPLNMAPAGDGDPGQRSQRHVDLPDCGCAACRAVSRETEILTSSRSQVPSPERRASLADERRRIMEAYIPLYQDVADRMVRREVQDIRRAFDKHMRKRNMDKFAEWLADYYKELEPVLADAFRPVMLSLAALVAQFVAAELDLEAPTTQDEISEFVDEYLAGFAEGYVASSEGQLRALATDSQNVEGIFAEIFRDKLEERLEEWLLKKAAKVALRQSFQAGNGLIVANYTAKGVERLIWTGGDCPFCAKLDGKTVSITEFFVTAGEFLAGDGDDTPMLMRSNKRHGPLHGGCDCTVVAG